MYIKEVLKNYFLVASGKFPFYSNRNLFPPIPEPVCVFPGLC